MSEHTVAATIQERLQCYVPDRKTPLVIACSGGSDSVAVVLALARGGWIRSVIGHVDHGIQNDENRQMEARAVDALGALTGFPVIHQAIPAGVLRDRAVREGRSVEEVARTERYRLLCQVARTQAAPAIVCGHHQGDAVETVLLRLFSGRSPMEPLLIPEWRLLEADRGGIALLRPALHLSRDELVSFVREYPVSYHHDPGNSSTEYQRNRVRTGLIPALKQVFPEHPVEQGILSLARELQDLRRDALAMVPAGVLLEDREKQTVLSRTLFFSLPPSVGELFLRQIVYRLTMDTRFPWKPVRQFLRNLGERASGELTVRDLNISVSEQRIVVAHSLVPVLRRGYLIGVHRPGTVTLVLSSPESKTIQSVQFSEDRQSVETFPEQITLPLVIRDGRKNDFVEYNGRRRSLTGIAPLDTLTVLEDRRGIVAVLQSGTAFYFRDGIDCKSDATTRIKRELPLRFVCKEWKSYAEQ